MSEAELAEIRRERQLALADEEASREHPAPVPPPAPRVAENVQVTVEPEEPKPVEAKIAWTTRFNLAEIFAIYDAGKLLLKRAEHVRWRDTLALAFSSGSVFLGRDEDGAIRQLAVLWRTANPVVDIKRKVPDLDKDGHFVYIAWQWNELGERGMQALRKHISSLAGVRFVAGFDQRRGSKRGGRLVTHALHHDGSIEHG